MRKIFKAMELIATSRIGKARARVSSSLPAGRRSVMWNNYNRIHLGVSSGNRKYQLLRLVSGTATVASETLGRTSADGDIIRSSSSAGRSMVNIDGADQITTTAAEHTTYEITGSSSSTPA